MISIVIVNYHTKALIERCLASIAKYTPQVQKEIIIVDNAQELTVTDFPDCQLISNDHNLGFGAAVNRGIVASRGETVLFVNPDVQLKDDAISKMLKVLSEHPTIGIVGAHLQYPDGRTQACQGKFPSWTTLFLTKSRLYKIFNYGMYYIPNFHTVTLVDWVSGGFMLIRKNVLDTIGLFDDQFFMFYEDMDICIRAWADGFAVAFLPEAVVIHDQGSSYRKNKHIAARYSRESLRYFLKKHGLKLRLR